MNLVELMVVLLADSKVETLAALKDEHLVETLAA
jgi:hypothetical protein